MSQQFPKLKENQVVLSRADRNTGTVLDESFKYANTLDQKVYTIYDHIEDAIKEAKQTIEDRPIIECYIHDRDQKLLYFFDIDSY